MEKTYMQAQSRGGEFLSALITGAMLLLVGLFTATNASAQGQSQAAAPVPKRISAGKLKKLRWIEGSWRGTGDVEKPFYERYRFENESTLVVESFDDETLGKITDVTRFVLKDGIFGNAGEGARWAATELKDDSVFFEPVVKARNSFRWQRESKDVWKATLNWPALGDKPARVRVYRMERITRDKR
jgi:hypothetical protein